MFDILFIVTLILFILTSIFSIMSLHSDNKIYVKETTFLFSLSVLSFLVMTVSMVYSSPSDGFNWIISSIWGFFYLFSLVLILLIIYLYFSRWRHQLMPYNAFAIPLITILLIISIPFIDSPRKIDTNFDHGLLLAHIFITIFGELLFFFSFVGSVFYLFMESQLKKKTSMKYIYRLSNLESLEKFNRWTISRAFILLTLGVIIGVKMAFINFSSPFLGSPKEITIYFTWLIILGLYYFRCIKKIASHKVSILNIIFFIVFMFLFIFSNIFITSGFHSFK